MIKWLLDNFGDAETSDHSTSFAGIHAIIFIYQFFVLEFAVITTTFLVYLVLFIWNGFELLWFLNCIVLVIIISTMFMGVYFVHNHKAKELRWFTIRIKTIYITLGLWAILDFFVLYSDWIDKILAGVKVIVSIIFMMEDKALMGILLHEQYHFRGMKPD